MKGTCYSGIVYLPEHPDADLHGLIRVCIREATMLRVHDKLAKINADRGRGSMGVWAAMIWQESKSHAEQQATERHYGELLACSLVLQYLRPENYKPIPKSLLRRKTS